jgi:hypothetical protein
MADGAVGSDPWYVVLNPGDDPNCAGPFTVRGFDGHQFSAVWSDALFGLRCSDGKLRIVRDRKEVYAQLLLVPEEGLGIASEGRLLALYRFDEYPLSGTPEKPADRDADARP